MAWVEYPGDVVQFSIILQHIARYRPEWRTTVRCGLGKHTALIGLCHHVCHDHEPDPPGHFDLVYDIGFWENYSRYAAKPNSKVTNCLDEEFNIDYNPEFERYKILVPDEAMAKAAAYFDSIGAKRIDGRYNVLVFHYEGNTSQNRKNLHVHQASAICAFAKDLGLIPVVLDWDRRSPLPDNKTIFCPAPKKPNEGPDLWGNMGTGDAVVITAMIAQAALYIGVDSGPGKCASATETPTLIVWKEMHPMQFHDPAPNTLHLIPDHWQKMPPCNDSPEVRETFCRKYQFITYDTSHDGEHALVEETLTWMQTALATKPEQLPTDKGELTYRWGFWMPKCPDLFNFWTIIEDVSLADGYKTRLRPRNEGLEYVVDVGANIGTFSRLWHKRNPSARIAAVEIHPKLVPALRENVGEFATVYGAACYYPDGNDVWLLDCFTPQSRNVGDSRLIDWQGLQRGHAQWYHRREEKVQCLSLEAIMRQAEFPRIDVLKLDCEGSEFNILRHCDLSKVGTIFMESHDPDQLTALLAFRFKGWDIGRMSRNGLNEILHLVNNQWPPRS